MHLFFWRLACEGDIELREVRNVFKTKDAAIYLIITSECMMFFFLSLSLSRPPPHRRAAPLGELSLVRLTFFSLHPLSFAPPQRTGEQFNTIPNST